MKKLLTVLLLVMCLLTLVGCKEKEPEIVGGWEDVGEELDDELIGYFEAATKDLTGVGYKPVRLLGKQVVAGMNYKYLVEATIMNGEKTTSMKVITIYVDLDGKASINGDIEDYKE